ncbi:class III signal peptide-containing protein [Methanobrevibacter sp.]|uniref:class III signal peptide-containing protein n=1 Tax=Methanobrevibacter sp. TaxID=66852 RepID=UPI003862F81F
MSETQYSITGPMFRKKLDKKGQGSAELILITGGLIVIILLVGSYISNITDKTQQNLNSLLKEERDFLLNKI